MAFTTAIPAAGGKSASATQASAKLDICIRGNGIVAHALALLLARERLRIGLYRGDVASSSRPEDVRAYALNSAARELLQSLRVWPPEALATPVRRMEVLGDEGGRVQFDAQRQQLDALNWMVDVPALEQRLDQAVQYQSHIELLTQPCDAALTVICEGRDSVSRSQYRVRYQCASYGQRGVAARLLAEQPHGEVARQWLAPLDREGEVLALLPLSGVGGRELALVWSAAQDHADELMQMEAADFAAQVTKASGHALGDLQLASVRAQWPLQLAQASRWVGPGFALAGDAAHSLHPLAGQGLNLGLGDASVLARVIHGREPHRALGDLQLLRRYERARALDIQAMRLATDGLFQLFAQSPAPLRSLRNWGMQLFDRSGPLKQWVTRRAMGL
jgi:2-polyprenyl-6-methoxyphenol hydroxylase-like FAD-dependent oxidoreductase